MRLHISPVNLVNSVPNVFDSYCNSSKEDFLIPYRKTMGQVLSEAKFTMELFYHLFFLFQGNCHF